MKCLFIFLFNFCILLSCTTTNYYLCTVDQPIPFYATMDTSQVLFYIPAGKQLIIQKKENGINYVSFGHQFGFINREYFRGITKYSQQDVSYLSFRSDSTYAYVRNGYSGSKEPYKASGNTSSSSSYRSSSDSATTSSNSGGTVQVKGYYRKDGTYVKPHTRSAPKRRG